MKYYILYNDENRGPLEIEEMEEYGLNPTSRVWAPGMPSWQDAGEVPEIQAYFQERDAKAAKARAEAKAKEEEAARAQAAQAASRQQSVNNNYTVNIKNGNINTNNTTTSNTTTSNEQEPDNVNSPVEWYIAINNQEVGPFEITQLVANGLTPTTLVWRDGLTNWVQARTLPELAGILPAPASEVSVSPSPVQNETPATFDDASLPSSMYATGIGALIACVAAAALTFSSASFYDGIEKFKLLLFCAIPSLILAVASIFYANSAKTSINSQLPYKANLKAGIAIGLGIGGIVAAILGCVFAATGFDLV